MSQEERKKFESLKSDFNKYWVPCVWFTNLAAQARRDGQIRDDISFCLILEVSPFRIWILGSISSFKIITWYLTLKRHQLYTARYFWGGGGWGKITLHRSSLPGTHYLAQAGLKPMAILPSSPKLRNHRHEPLGLATVHFGSMCLR